MAGSATRGGDRPSRHGGARATSRSPSAPARARARARAASPESSPPVTAALGRRRLVVLLTVTMYMFGLVMVASASSGELLLQDLDQWAMLKRQAIFGLIGLGAMFVTMRMPLDVVRRLAVPGVWACAVLVVLVMVPGLGHSANGAARWINLGFFQLQPSEPLKLAVIAMVSAHLARTPPPVHWMNDFVRSPGGAAIGIAGILVALQSDLGTGIVVVASTVTLYVLAGTSIQLLGRTVLPLFALGALSIVTEEYRRDRFLAFVDPWANPEAGGYQLIQALLAIGSGGPFGVGLGHSVQKIAFLPEAHTDMIFAIVVEELGLFGVVFVIGAFAVLAAVGTRIAMRARTRFSALLAAGITAMIVGQAFINLGGVTGVLPLTGIPLPLISYGGSSLIMTLAALGLLANIATERRPARSFTIPPPKLAEPPEYDPHDDLDADWFDDAAAPRTHPAADGAAPARAGRGWRNRRPSGPGAGSR